MPVQVEQACFGRTSKAACSTRSLVVVLEQKRKKGYYPIDTLVECVKQLVELFHPRLVLGISDEISPDGEIERVRLVGELVKELA